MMGLPFARSRPLIGVDLSGRWIKAVQASRRSSPGVRIARPRPGDAFSREDAALLAGVLERTGFQGNRVVVTPPRESIIAEVLELPPRNSGAPLEQLAKLEIARAHKCDAGSLQVGLWELPSPARAGDQAHVFAAAMSFARSTPILDAFEAAGLEVAAIDVPANALARAHAGGGLPDAMLELGWSGALLCVMHAGVVVYERFIVDAAVSALVENAAERLSVPREAIEAVVVPDPASGAMYQDSPLWEELRGLVAEHLEATAEEVGRSLAYMANRYHSWQFRRLALSGDGAHLPGLSERLASELQVQVSVGADGCSTPASLLMAWGAARYDAAGAQRKEAA